MKWSHTYWYRDFIDKSKIRSTNKHWRRILGVDDIDGYDGC